MVGNVKHSGGMFMASATAVNTGTMLSLWTTTAEDVKYQVDSSGGAAIRSAMSSKLEDRPPELQDRLL